MEDEAIDLLNELIETVQKKMDATDDLEKKAWISKVYATFAIYFFGSIYSASPDHIKSVIKKSVMDFIEKEDSRHKEKK